MKQREEETERQKEGEGGTNSITTSAFNLMQSSARENIVCIEFASWLVAAWVLGVANHCTEEPNIKLCSV